MATVAVVGVGGIGGVVAWQLAAAGHEVTLCTRRPFDRLGVLPGDVETSVDARVISRPDELGPVDWVFLATKIHQTAGAAAWVRAGCGPNTQAVVVLQNGVGHGCGLGELPHRTPVVPTVVLIAAEARRPGLVAHLGGSTIVMPEGDAGRAVQALVASAPGLEVEVVDDFEVRSWHKLVMNATAGPITALTGRRLDVFDDPAVRALAQAVADEVVAVARAERVPLDDGTAREVVDTLARQGGAIGTSMLADHQAGRTTEVEGLTGDVARRARAVGVVAPLCEALSTLLRASDQPDASAERPAVGVEHVEEHVAGASASTADRAGEVQR